MRMLHPRLAYYWRGSPFLTSCFGLCKCSFKSVTHLPCPSFQPVHAQILSPIPIHGRMGYPHALSADRCNAPPAPCSDRISDANTHRANISHKPSCSPFSPLVDNQFHDFWVFTFVGTLVAHGN